MAYSNDDLVTAGVLEKMLRRFASLMSDPSAASPRYNAATGRYDNLADWISLQLDGLVYGVQEPLYDYSPATTAVKVDANAGLVLEASTDSSAGRNDYLGKALFLCPRVNGGVDADGQPYVTAIEGYDDRFDPTKNTYVLTPVYYERHTLEGNYVVHRYTDTPRAGFSACSGAYQKGKPVPFILRACFLDADGTMSSRSGTQPATNVGSPSKVGHCANWDFSQSRARTADGLTYLTYGDVAYWFSFMQLMLGVKAPRAAAVGCVDYNYQYNVAVAESGVKRVVLSDAQAANIITGSSVAVGSYTAANKDRGQATVSDIALATKVLSKVALGDGTTALNLDLTETIDVPEGALVSTMPWRNGSCDNVLGTFGSQTAAGLTNGKMPFRFQNIELELGVYEVVCNMYSNAVVSDGVALHTWWIAPNVSACTGINKAAGWEALAQQTEGASGGWRYIKDYAHEHGAMVPAGVGGTSTTGVRVGWYPSASTADRETLVGGALDGGASAGVGCVASNNALASANWGFGGRSSAIGHAAEAA